MGKNNGFMEQALRAAFSAMGATSPNPAVGAVLVKDGIALGSGATCECGSDHAEVDAIKRAATDLTGAHLYVTLEPCCHHGKTPPCTDAIINAGITRVITPLLDPNPEVSGRGVRTLREAGVEVVLDGAHRDAASDLIRPFGKYISTRTPFVVHKSALTMDGKTAVPGGDSKWISSAYSRYLVHRLRSRVDAIIVGKNTVACDDPSLTVRLDSFPADVKEYFARADHRQGGRENYFLKMLLDPEVPCMCGSPLRVVIGLPDHLTPKMKIIGDGRVLFYARESGPGELREGQDMKFIETLAAQKAIVFTGIESRTAMVDFILKDLGARGIMFAMLEGGARLAGSFLDAGAIDQVLYMMAPRLAGAGLSAMEGRGKARIADTLPLHDISTVMLGDDLVYTAYRAAAANHE
ncbi:MAG: bifunctional diaminohydroxyphosphoribosylaminopyrimidine deaminase/5-amino-6-(5-phosphoribosylamino)uracil reductase RibD [Spirochaetes bacterium]|nr:MAG: bifunctional diaminohydroxyphosphoribosylaminopyrimidine deaminase/5-amino-6-(5-phosphoribosylamino)uracil reductase RibD [Spirochaetota bacterium]